MSTSEGRIYKLLTSLVVVGYAWLYFNVIMGLGSNYVVCPIKNATDFPCPSCGSTRSVISMFHGDLNSAFTTNPFGILIFVVMLILPIGLLFDFVFNKRVVWKYYQKIESLVSHKLVAIPLILLVLINWMWNIFKGI